MAYCPITNLENADMAYEWIFNGVNEYHQRKGSMIPPAAQINSDIAAAPARPDNALLDTVETALMTEREIAVSAELKNFFRNM